ncbi:hypothetical protein [Aggregatilinea lenta]|uniref:hypothetical protein n=1 Tax=Aggregatilinea lenta TaxID=913108 RepID=UPI000E5AC92A|nr:hypothetical protein [Aggregatilinea lenta]
MSVRRNGKVVNKPGRRSSPTTLGDRLAVPVSSGYTLRVHRPSMQVIRAINAKALELHPDPEPPVQTVEAVTGVVYRVAASEDDPAFAAANKAYEQGVERAQAARAEYLLDYVFRERLSVEGYETDEARAALVAQYAPERAAVEQYGTLPDDMRDLDDWQFVLRMFVVADAVDYGAVTLAAHKAFDVADVTEDELRARVTFL